MKSVSLTTNGVTLSHKLAALLEAGLTGINISLDTLQPKKFEFITRRRGFDKVVRGLHQALDAGVQPLKVSDCHPTSDAFSGLQGLSTHCIRHCILMKSVMCGSLSFLVTGHVLGDYVTVVC